MREIEIKARVENSEQTLAALQRLGIHLGKPAKQHDVVYGQLNSTGTEFISGGNWLRIRTEDETNVIFTFKRSVTGELDSIEHEVTVDNAKELEAIIRELGYSLYSDLTKIRRKAKTGDIELCYDEVPGLGSFIELEKLCPEDTDLDTIVRELWDAAKQLGVSKADEEMSGYDVLMRQKEGKPVYGSELLVQANR